MCGNRARFSSWLDEDDVEPRTSRVVESVIRAHLDALGGADRLLRSAEGKPDGLELSAGEGKDLGGAAEVQQRAIFIEGEADDEG